MPKTRDRGDLIRVVSSERFLSPKSLLAVGGFLGRLIGFFHNGWERKKEREREREREEEERVWKKIERHTEKGVLLLNFWGASTVPVNDFYLGWVVLLCYLSHSQMPHPITISTTLPSFSPIWSINQSFFFASFTLSLSLSLLLFPSLGGFQIGH